VASTSVAQALVLLTRDPLNVLVRKWNWKCALFSSLTRAWVFFFANLTAGWRAAVGAMAAEFVFRGFTSGFYGALTQNFRNVRPAWTGALAVMILLPLTSHSLELLVHWLRHTPNLFASIVSSVCFTAVSTLFNWYAMNKGAMVVGSDGQTLARDMLAMPRIIGCFLAEIPLFFWRLPATLHESEDAASD
jgi:hypothetical protein